MKSGADEQMQYLASQVQEVALTLLERTDAVVTAEQWLLLGRFSEAARESPLFGTAGEIARSLANLLAGREGQFLDDQVYLQTLAIGQSLIDALNLGGHAQEQESLIQLVTPIPPSKGRLNEHLVLLVKDDHVLMELHEAADKAGFTASRFRELAELESLDDKTCPAAVIADIAQFELDPNAAAIIAGLRSRFNPPPHLFLMGKSNDIPARLEAVRLGATRFIPNPPDVGRLMSILKGVTAKTPGKPFRVLLIDDDRVSGASHALALSKAGMEAQSLCDPLKAPFKIAQYQPDVIVSDIFMRGCNGLELLAVLRQDDALLDTPFVFLSSESDPRRQIEALELGADKFLSKPVSIPLFVATVVALARRSRRLKRTRNDFHVFLKGLRAGEISLSGAVPEESVASFEDELLPPGLIPNEDYVVEEGFAEKLPDTGL